MGVNIGSASRAITSLASAGVTRPERVAVSNPNGEKPGQLVRDKEAPEIRAGFGENTLSPSGAALKTLDSNLRAAAQLVPSVEELRERARLAQARREEALASSDTAPVEFKQPERVRPEPSPAVRNFFQRDTVPAEPAATQRPDANPPEESAPAKESPETSGSRLNLQA